MDCTGFPCTIYHRFAVCFTWAKHKRYRDFKRLTFFFFLVAQVVKNLPVMQEIQIQSLGQEDALEKEMPTHSSILAWNILWTEEPGGLQSMGSQESDTT